MPKPSCGNCEHLPPASSTLSSTAKPNSAKLLDRIYSGSIEERLGCARELYHLLQQSLRGDSGFSTRLTELKKRAGRVNEQMGRMEFSRLCPECASDPRRGGCCSLYMTGETDALQLLLNLLAGINVHQVRDDGRECSYLGLQGCILLFKPMFCLNYLCDGIQKGCRKDHLQELEQYTGNLLRVQYELEQELLQRIRSLY